MEKERIERIVNFVKREDIVKKLRGAVSFLIPSRSDVRLEIEVGGGSFTDGKVVVVSVPNLFFDRTEEEIYIALRALVGHECQHVNSTSFSAYRKSIDRMCEHFTRKFKYQVRSSMYFREYIISMSRAFCNGVEDGRIENILVSKWPGYEKYLKFLNGTVWKETSVSGDEVRDFQMSIVSFSVTGLLPQGFDLYKGKRLEAVMNELIPQIKKAIKARTSEECFAICEQMMIGCESYIFDLYQEQVADDVSKRLEMVKQAAQDEEFEWVEGTEENINPSNQNHFDIKQEKPQEEQQESVGVQSETSEESEESSKNKEDRHAGSGDEEGNDTENDEAEEGEEGEKAETKGNKTLKITEFEELFREVEEKALNEAKKQIKTKEAECNETELEGLSEDDIDSVCILYGRKSKSSFREKQIPRRHVKAISNVPNSWKNKANMFKKEVRKIKHNKMARTMRGQKVGILDTERLYLMPTKQFDIFKRKKVPFEHDYVFYVLEDGSGSMSGDKERYSKEALFMIEQGLKDHFPLKITTFSSDNVVEHYVMKEFDENVKHGSFVYNAYKERRADGGNKDGFSVRIATKELLKRPEKEKVLIIMSDGLPSDYSSEEAAISDVKEAVKEARKAGIHVVAIMFGEKSFREENIQKYKTMYEKNIISCEPSRIPSQFFRLFGKLLNR